LILQTSLILQLLGPPPRVLRLGLNLAYFLHCPWDQSRTDEFLIASLSNLKQESELHNSPTSHVFLLFAELSKNSKNLNYISGAVMFLISTQHMKLTRHVLVSRTVGCRSILQSSRNTIMAETCRKYQSFSMCNELHQPGDPSSCTIHVSSQFPRRGLPKRVGWIEEGALLVFWKMFFFRTLFLNIGATRYLVLHNTYPNPEFVAIGSRELPQHQSVGNMSETRSECDLSCI
jgi:hypothetical protein